MASIFPPCPCGEWELTSLNVRGARTAISLPSRQERAPSACQAESTVQDLPVIVLVSVSQGTTRLQGFARRRKGGFRRDGGAGARRILGRLTALRGAISPTLDGSFLAARCSAQGGTRSWRLMTGGRSDWMQPAVIARYLPGGKSVTVPRQSWKRTTLTTPVPVCEARMKGPTPGLLPSGVERIV